MFFSRVARGKTFREAYCKHWEQSGPPPTKLEAESCSFLRSSVACRRPHRTDRTRLAGETVKSYNMERVERRMRNKQMSSLYRQDQQSHLDPD